MMTEVEDFDMDDQGEEEEDEEPLFADELGEDDDLPPLPPPMPSLSQLNSRQNGSTLATRTDAGDAGGGPGTDQALPPAAQTDDQGQPLKKRKPLLTLTVDRIFSDKGLPYLESEFPKLKFRGKGHEGSDLQFLMKQYEHWANRLFPKYTFKDVTDRIERLSTTREFKSRVMGIRCKHARGGKATPPLVDSDDEEVPAAPLANGVGTPAPVVSNDKSHNSSGGASPFHGHTPAMSPYSVPHTASPENLITLPKPEGEDLATESETEDPPEPEGEDLATPLKLTESGESRLSSDEESLDGLRIVDPDEAEEGSFES